MYAPCLVDKRSHKIAEEATGCIEQSELPSFLR
jgi:hypothetical protein